MSIRIIGIACAAVLMWSSAAWAQNSNPIIAGAGDIAESGGRQLQTSNLLINQLNANPDTWVFTAGDNAYPSGRASDFANFYNPTWGRAQIKNRTLPTPGNHDYATSGGTGYYGYFGAVASQSTNGFYVREFGQHWVGIFMNSEADHAGQTNRLRTALRNAVGKNVFTVWHKPRFAIGSKGSIAALKPWWDLMDQFDVDVAISGHEHIY